MFTILHKSVGGRESQRYFKKWDAAKAEMLECVNRSVNEFGCTIDQVWDVFNYEKGIYNFEYRLTNKEGERVVYALVDGYFEDEPSA